MLNENNGSIKEAPEISASLLSPSGKQNNTHPEDMLAKDPNDNDDDDAVSKSDNLLNEEDEDVPADFFDDFANEDFMEGLDIVDAWDEGKLMQEEEEEEDLLKNRKHSPIRYSKSPDRRRQRRSSPASRRRKHSSGLRSKSRDDRVHLSERRDPEKTKRDINRDKIKCAKDREQKMVNDKLRLVETGLVPPGMEMDVDVSSILRERTRSMGKSAERVRERRPSRRSLSRERKRSRHSRSPFRRRRTSSRGSDISERDSWMRARKRHRSPSPLEREKRKYEEMKKKKKSFLEEIRDKLNETSRSSPVVNSPAYHVPQFDSALRPIPVPAPVPAPQFFPHQYDQSFFIGDAAYPNYNNLMPVQVQVAAPVSTPPAPTLISPNLKTVQVQKEIETKPLKHSSEDIDKLFADKKISLSDFLTITAKCEAQASNPELLQKKIKVISRCNDAIKALSDDRRFSGGRLTVQPSANNINKSDFKYQSPLRRIPVIRFQYTSPPKITEDMDTFALALDKMLQKIGIIKEKTEEKVEPKINIKEITKIIRVEKECEECKLRKMKTFTEVGSQCVDSKETEDRGTQVTDEDLNPKPKNDSIAYLTPAQLLGISKDNKEKKDTAAMEKVEVSPKKAADIPPLFKQGRGGFRSRPQPNYYEQNEYYEYDQQFDNSQSYARYGGPRFPPQFNQNQNFGEFGGRGMRGGRGRGFQHRF